MGEKILKDGEMMSSSRRKICLKVRTQEESIRKTYYHADTHNDNTTDESNNNKSVRWSDLKIQFHPICLGDNPSVTYGPPLSLSWDIISTITISVDEYENNREERRENFQLIIPKGLREQWLYEEGHSSLEICDTMREIQIIQRQQKKTYAKFYFYFHGHGKYLKRIKKYPITLMRKAQPFTAGVLNRSTREDRRI